MKALFSISIEYLFNFLVWSNFARRPGREVRLGRQHFACVGNPQLASASSTKISKSDFKQSFEAASFPWPFYFLAIYYIFIPTNCYEPKSIIFLDFLSCLIWWLTNAFFYQLLNLNCIFSWPDWLCHSLWEKITGWTNFSLMNPASYSFKGFIFK